MGWFGDLRGGQRLLVELRGLRKAAERIADCLELQAGSAPRLGGQAFRGFSHSKVASDGAGSGVSYADTAELERAYQVEGELVAILGRSPTEQELEVALRGDIE